MDVVDTARINAQCELDNALMALPDSKLIEFTINTERIVRQKWPDAKLLFTEDKRGNVTGCGIYDLRLLLNERNNFKTSQQHSPQLLGRKIAYRDEFDKRAQLVQQFHAWSSAFVHLYSLELMK